MKQPVKLTTVRTNDLRLRMLAGPVRNQVSSKRKWIRAVALAGLIGVPMHTPLMGQSPEHPTGHSSHTVVKSYRSHEAVQLPIPSAISSGPYGNQVDLYRNRVLENETISEDDANCWFPNSPALSDYSPMGGEVSQLDPQIVWWDADVTQPLGLAQQHTSVDASGLAQTALIASPYVRSLLTEPQISMTDIVIADAQFDPLTFLDANYTDTNDPVGSELTTGDQSERFRDNLFASSAGVRKKLTGGGNLEVVQRGGYQNNNSTFLIPNPQGTSRLELNFSQPLLRDHGKAVNRT
ncbi:MAG: TolC family protein, partial [Rhodopirellula bahusiensis]